MPSRLRRLVRSISKLDVALSRHVVERWPSPLKSVLDHLSNLADHSKLWMFIAAAQALAGGRAGRRAAQRGLLSVGVASLITNAVLKPLFPRTRPPVDPSALPGIVARPRSSSFPSGHAASAAAYAVAGALEAPRAAPPIAALAAAVAASRVTSGVHYPSDVIVGAAIGAACAWGSTLAWPLVDDDPADAATAPWGAQQALAEVSERGDGLVLLANAASGRGAAADLVDEIHDALPDARIVTTEPGQDPAAVLAEWASSATILGVLGGDGTISAAAAVAVEHDLPLAVFPGGTLNHFARDLGIDTIEEAIEAVVHGHVARVDVGRIDGRLFVNTASFGSYSEFVAARERLEPTIGKWPAMLHALVTVLVRGEPTEVRIDGRPRSIWMIFIGNGSYDPPGFAPASRSNLADGRLDVRVVDGTPPASRMRLVASLVIGRLGRSRIYRRELRSEVEVDFGRPTAMLAADGEVFEGPGRFVISLEAEALQVIVPPQE